MKKRCLAIVSLFVILTAITTYPLVFKLNTHIPGFSDTFEPYHMVWEGWKMKYSHDNNLGLDDHKFIAYPFGPPKIGSVNFFIGIFIIKWLSIFTNPVFTYNFYILLSFILSGFFTYLLVKHLTKDTQAAILSGIIFAFCPYHFARSWQHFGLAQIQWMPLYLLALFTLKEKKSFRNVLFVSLSFFLVALDYTYTYLMLIVTLVFIVFSFLDKNDKEKKRLFLFFSLAAIFIFFATLPATYVVYKNLIFGPPKEAMKLYYRPFSDLFIQSAKPLSYILPSTEHPIFGDFTKRFVGSSLWGVSLTGHQLYLGSINVFLAFFAFRTWRKKRKQKIQHDNYFYISFFIALTIVAWFLSQPPWWSIASSRVFMPSFFMYKLLPMFREYSRFGVVVVLSVSVLAGYGLKCYRQRFKTKNRRMILSYLLCGLVLFEFWNWPPYKVIDVSKAPQAYYWLKEQPGEFAIAEYPLDIKEPCIMYEFHQIFHNRPIINATGPNTYPNKVAETIIRLSDQKTASALRWMGVKYVVVHRDGYLKTGLVEEIEELGKIFKNKGLKFVRTFLPQECSSSMMCTQKSGQIDIYEVVARPIEPKLDHLNKE